MEREPHLAQLAHGEADLASGGRADAFLERCAHWTLGMLCACTRLARARNPPCAVNSLQAPQACPWSVILSGMLSGIHTSIILSLPIAISLQSLIIYGPCYGVCMPDQDAMRRSTSVGFQSSGCCSQAAAPAVSAA